MDKDNDATAEIVDLGAAKSARKQTKKRAKCPVCGKAVTAKFKPFCSKRCADVDLGKWLGEGYRIPTEEVPGFDEGFDGGFDGEEY